MISLMMLKTFQEDLVEDCGRIWEHAYSQPVILPRLDNPAYNADRKPINGFGIRQHTGV